jgi:hypothetical protein
MSRPRGPEDRKPLDAPAFPELHGLRFQLPVKVLEASGVLVIRVFDDGRENDIEVSVRGRAVLLLDAERRNKR